MPMLYVEKGVKVTVKPVFENPENVDPEYEWSFYDWDTNQAMGVVCTDEAYTFTFEHEGNVDFFCNGLTEDQNYDYWYNNIYVLEYFNPM